MERWLSKSRVLCGLCAVLLVAALNRRDPMVYGMFLFLAVVTVLGFVLPWLSLRSTGVRIQSAGGTEVVEGGACDLDVVVERRLPWPAFMVDVETEWEWAGQRTVLRQTLPVVRAGRAQALGRRVQFAVRGRYALVAVRLSSGFPLGLVRAQHSMARPDIHLQVEPRALPVHWPLPWDVTEDPQGERTTRKMGPSFDLGMLRPYQQGEAVGRVSWRASARTGGLVIQHFQHSGSVRLRVAVDLPRAPALGDPGSAGEQAVRLAAGVCAAALDHGAQLFVYLDAHSAPLQDGPGVRRALAGALPDAGGVALAVARLAMDVAAGEQVAVVVGAAVAQDALRAALAVLQDRGCGVVVCIAVARQPGPAALAQVQDLQRALEQAGYATLQEAA